MADTFSGYEIVELGVEIEKNGYDFYNEIYRKSKNGKAKILFEFLREAEKKHIAVFRTLLEKVHGYQPQGTYPEEYFAYMNTLAKKHVFTKENKGSEIAKKIKSDAEAVELGIKFEKESIVFYEGMRKVVPKHENNIVDKLIKEEEEHLTKLTNLSEAMTYGAKRRKS